MQQASWAVHVYPWSPLWVAEHWSDIWFPWSNTDNCRSLVDQMEQSCLAFWLQDIVMIENWTGMRSCSIWSRWVDKLIKENWARHKLVHIGVLLPSDCDEFVHTELNTVAGIFYQFPSLFKKNYLSIWFCTCTFLVADFEVNKCTGAVWGGLMFLHWVPAWHAMLERQIGVESICRNSTFN